MTEIEKILGTHGPMLSGDLGQLIEKSTSLSKEAIRQRISRAKEPVKKIAGFFSNNQTFLYLKKHQDTKAFSDGFKAALKSSAKRFHSILLALEYHKGYLSANQLPSYAFSPVQKLIGHKQYNAILDEMQSLSLVMKEDDLYKINPTYSESKPDQQKYRAIEIAKNFILNQFHNWARDTGFTSYNTGTFHSEFGKLLWNFTSPSYLNSLYRFNQSKKVPGFIVADILIGAEATDDNVHFFIEKIGILNAQKKLPKVLPILIVDSLSSDALATLKKNGVFIGFVNKLFGNGYRELLAALINTVSNAGAILRKNPEAYLKLLDQINSLVDGKTNNLRGDLFELAVGYYHGRKCNSLDIGKIIYWDGFKKEIDVFAKYSDEIVVAECKGYKRKISKDEIEDWFTRISILRSWILAQDEYVSRDLTFEFWSTGGFEDDAKIYLDAMAGKTKKYKIKYYDKHDIITKAKETKSKKFIDMLNQYYFREEL